MRYVIKPKFLVEFDGKTPKISDNVSILIEDDRILEIGKSVNEDGAEVIELENHVVMPGMINTHTHAAMTLFRGYADDIPLDEWLNEYIWPLEDKLTNEQVTIGAKLAAIEAINFGTTTMNSMYWHPDGEIEAFTEIGCRLMSGPPIISGVNTITDYEYLIKDYHGSEDDLIRIALNPHAPYTVTDEEYQEIHEYKESYNQDNDGPKLKIHTHLEETMHEYDMVKNYAEDNHFDLRGAESITQYFDKLGILDNDLIVAHAIECSVEDIQLLADKDVAIAINTGSNLKLGNNIVNLHNMMEQGGRCGLGTDGPASNNSLDMIETMKLTSLTQKTKHNNPAITTAEEMIYLATKGGADVLGWEGIGEIKPGNKADLVAINLDQPHLQPITNDSSIFSEIVYSAKGTDVSDVMINGEWKKREGNLLIDNIPEIQDKFKTELNKLLNY